MNWKIATAVLVGAVNEGETADARLLAASNCAVEGRWGWGAHHHAEQRNLSGGELLILTVGGD